MMSLDENKRFHQIKQIIREKYPDIKDCDKCIKEFLFLLNITRSSFEEKFGGNVINFLYSEIITRDFNPVTFLMELKVFKEDLQHAENMLRDHEKTCIHPDKFVTVKHMSYRTNSEYDQFGWYQSEDHCSCSLCGKGWYENKYTTCDSNRNKKEWNHNFPITKKEDHKERTYL